MPIQVDMKRKVTVDTETGEYLVYKPTHPQDPYEHFTLRDSDDAPIFAANIESNAIDETGEGGATVVRYTVRKVWFPSGEKKAPTYFWGKTKMIDRLCEFVRVWHDFPKNKNPHPRFEFEDGREQRGVV
ncbi:hypothetical protein [Aurantiacibacter sp. MUD61]|uniref:hypothetical protein n=1 Tax=Aurantiacibacter sp. MUD61 TaxID=3009083 RepID=UPI0022F12FF9|nr:hypothetical protein [Aurantiacibacter sp. MUD61]